MKVSLRQRLICVNPVDHVKWNRYRDSQWVDAEQEMFCILREKLDAKIVFDAIACKGGRWIKPDEWAPEREYDCLLLDGVSLADDPLPAPSNVRGMYFKKSTSRTRQNFMNTQRRNQSADRVIDKWFTNSHHQWDG